ncbi:MAG TPA: hypothetical protein VEA78_03045 [Acidimicrobiales bacterium]|nr:hypothetical protein [Acidimicrobiales bacterium]
MSVRTRWVLGCAVGCLLWTLPGPAAAVGVFLGGIPLAVMMGAVLPQRRPLVLGGVTSLFPVAAVPAALLGASAGLLHHWLLFVVPFMTAGALLGLIHRFALGGGGARRRWAGLGALAGPLAWLVALGWHMQLPLGAIAGAGYGLLTCALAERAIEASRP